MATASSCSWTPTPRSGARTRPPSRPSRHSSSSRLRKNRVKGTRVLVPRRYERRRTAPIAAELIGADVPTQLAGSSRGLGEVADTDQVIDRQPEDEHPAHPRPAAVPRLAQQADGLEPAEDLFDALTFPLAHHVPGVARGALIDRTGTIRR